MSITENPKWGQPRVPEGTFIVFSFDPLAYATACDPTDKTLAAAAGRIPRKKYLGLIEGVGMVDLPGLRQNPDIRVVGRAPPRAGEDSAYHTGPTRCVPVHPSTAHPEGRAPLVPSVPLPWRECYVHTLQLVNAFVSRVHHANPTNAAVSKEELGRLSDLIVDDQCGAAADRRAAQAERGAEEGDLASESESSDYSDEDDGSDSDSRGDYNNFAAPDKVYIEIWEDLTTAKTLGQPKDVGGEIDRIVQLGEEWAARKKQEKRVNAARHTSKWAAEVGSFKIDDPTRRGEISKDDAPALAAEHRTERDVSALRNEPHPAVSVPALQTANRIPAREPPQNDRHAARNGLLQTWAENADSLRNWIRHIMCL